MLLESKLPGAGLGIGYREIVVTVLAGKRAAAGYFEGGAQGGACRRRSPRDSLAEL